MRIIKLSRESEKELKETLAKRSTNHFEDIEKKVFDIIENVIAIATINTNTANEIFNASTAFSIIYHILYVV